MAGRVIPSVTNAAAVRDSPHLTRDSILIFCISMSAFTAALPPEFVGLEARHALFAQTMLHTGPSFFPRTYLGPYPDYSATGTILIYPLARWMGHVTALYAVLPTAVVSALILVVTYLIAAMRRPSWGWFAVLTALATHQFFDASRSISPDQYTTLVTAFCFYRAYSALRRDTRPSWTLFAAAFAVGYGFRGPIGLVVPAGVVCAFYAAQGDYRRAIQAAGLGVLMLAACSGLLLTAAHREGGGPFVQRVLRMQAFGRLGGKWDGAAFYWIKSFTSYAVAYPIAVVVAGAHLRRFLARTQADGEQVLLRHVAIWAAVVLVGLSLPGEKRMRYILPASPAFALLASYVFVGESADRILSWTRRVLLSLCGWLPALSLLCALFAFLIRAQFAAPLDARRLIAAIIVLGVGTAAWSAAILAGRACAPLLRVTVAAACLVVAHIGVVETAMVSLEGGAPFVSEVRAAVEQDPGPIVFWRMGPDQEDIRFMVNYDAEASPQFTSSVEGLLDSDRRAWFVSGERAFAELSPDTATRFTIRVRGRIGHERCVAFRFTEEDDANKLSQ